MHRPDVHPFDWIAGAARDLVPAGELVGVEGDAHFFSPRGYFALANGLPGNRLVDSAELVNWVRLVKSPSEVGRLRIAGAIAERAMRIACEQLRPGRRQCDLVAEILAAQAIGIPGHGGEYPALVPLLPTGAASGTPHLTWSDRPFRIGEATTIELAGVFGRYHAPLARTVMLGDPPQRLIDTANVVAEAMDVDVGCDPPRRHRRCRARGVRPRDPVARAAQGFADRVLDRHRLSARTGVSAP